MPDSRLLSETTLRKVRQMVEKAPHWTNCRSTWDLPPDAEMYWTAEYR